jgi:hypothetical protein
VSRELVQTVFNFYERIASDARIGPTHISIYMALFYAYAVQGGGPLAITRSKVMALARVSGPATYHKCMADLVAGGYLRYCPSCNPLISTMVFLDC